MTLDFTGKTVAVIGGTSGMGLAIAQAVEAAGGRVAVLGRDDAWFPEASRSLSGLVRKGDAADPEAAAALLAEAGPVDGLVHVAGGSGRAFGDGPLHELTEDGLGKTMALNFHSAVWSGRAAVRHWLARGTGGSIVNIGSVLARSPSPEHFCTVAYASAKAAMEGFTRAIAAAYAERNIRANVVAPGLVETPMSSRAAENPEILSFVHRKQPLDGGRMGRPDDLTGAVLYLLSDAARFCTGQVLTVDGGWTLSGA